MYRKKRTVIHTHVTLPHFLHIFTFGLADVWHKRIDTRFNFLRLGIIIPVSFRDMHLPERYSCLELYVGTFPSPKIMSSQRKSCLIGRLCSSPSPRRLLKNTSANTMSQRPKKLHVLASVLHVCYSNLATYQT